MSDRWTTLLQMVNFRDQVAVTVLLMAAALLVGAFFVTITPVSRPARDRILQVFAGLTLVAWIAWLIILTTAEGL